MNRRTSGIVYILTHHTTVGILAGLALLFVLTLGGCTAKTPPDLSTVPGPDNTVYVSPTIIRPKGL